MLVTRVRTNVNRATNFNASTVQNTLHYIQNNGRPRNISLRGGLYVKINKSWEETFEKIYILFHNISGSPHENNIVV